MNPREMQEYSWLKDWHSTDVYEERNAIPGLCRPNFPGIEMGHHQAEEENEQWCKNPLAICFVVEGISLLISLLMDHCTRYSHRDWIYTVGTFTDSKPALRSLERYHIYASDYAMVRPPQLLWRPRQKVLVEREGVLTPSWTIWPTLNKAHARRGLVLQWRLIVTQVFPAYLK